MIYKIAEIPFQVKGTKLIEAIQSMKAFEPFISEGSPLFTVEYTDNQIDTTNKVELYDTGECDGAISKLYTLNNQYLIESYYIDNSGIITTWTQDNKIFITGDLSPQILRFSLWLAYGLIAIKHGRIPIHSSCIVVDNKAYLFLGESGTGKSTHTRLYRQYIPNAKLLNDDSPIVANENGEIYIYGSPWSGKTPCYKAEKYPLGGIVRLSQAPYNKIHRLPKIAAYGAIHPSCPPEFAYDDRLYDFISKTISSIVTTTPTYHLECLPDKEAVELSYKTLSE